MTGRSQHRATGMGAKRKDAAKKEENSEALTNGGAAPEKETPKAAKRETKQETAAAKAAAEAPNGRKNGKENQAPAVESVKEAAGQGAAKAVDTAKAAAAKTAAQVIRFASRSSCWMCTCGGTRLANEAAA